ncbi:aldo/keto reductase [Nonomuraea jabiensis]|uniref:Aryl-alcohol dehydrogenase-like predicted oxidoreductase n=1 Tax=Nonomuraea jabiensis TaxID=882448 RepID=A0A7W9GGD2_9ACTN|nr:aldo/keto reductase [Nonomuraea jabiensis]MBB5783334.1 aryl-alcohol dehydrogenase-like predicted oxidoreductase [Nonomuraea jabiensis]
MFDLALPLQEVAEVYGPYHNEELVGEAIAPIRDQVQIAIKLGWDIQGGRSVGLNSWPGQIRKVADASLRSLRVAHPLEPRCPAHEM